MPFMDRESFIALLDSFGDPDDATVLANARTVHARMRDAGISWDALLIPAPGSAVAPGADDDADEGSDADADNWRNAPPPELAPSEDDAADAALIDRMLAEYTLSEDTRRELMDLRADITAGEFTRQDSRYIRNLADRLSHKRRAG